MTETMTTLRQKPEATATSARVVEPTLISEKEVLFGTAAAAAQFPDQTRRRAGVFASILAALRNAAGPPEPVRRTDRHLYLETAMLSRAMERL